MSQDIIVSGMRPTGALHIGHYAAVIRNWVKLQEHHQCFFFIADWHALTGHYEDLEVIRKHRREYVRGWLACGLDPQKVHIYQQSLIPEVLYLTQFFLCLTPPGWADRSPSWKDLKENFQRKLDNLGFYTYPILQAADIAIVRGNKVPVGEDQVTHLEIAREIVRKFNRTYGTDLPEPEPLLTPVPKIVGTDGHKKMSSSLGNTISLQETEKSLQSKLNKLRTDDKREGPDKPGNPDNCTVHDYHKAFSAPSMVSEVQSRCRAGTISCGECKKMLGDCMKQELMPIAQKMNEITDEYCDQVLAEGTTKTAQLIK
ncbi:MAG: tryptophan--tRNA ligase, partial [Pseudomonadota bacterium]